MTTPLEVLLKATVATGLSAEVLGEWFSDLHNWEQHVGLVADGIPIEQVLLKAIELGDRIDRCCTTDEDDDYIGCAITMQIPLRRIIFKLANRIAVLENSLNTERTN